MTVWKQSNDTIEARWRFNPYGPQDIHLQSNHILGSANDIFGPPCLTGPFLLVFNYSRLPKKFRVSEAYQEGEGACGFIDLENEL